MAKQVACALGGLRAELHAARDDNATLSPHVDELEGGVEVLQAANEGLESEADKNSQKLKAKAAEAAQYRAERPSPLRLCSDLSFNALTGSVPSWLSTLTNLVSLCVPPLRANGACACG